MNDTFPTRDQYIARLAAKRKPVVDLRAEGLKAPEIAARLGMTINQVRSALRTERDHARKEAH